MGWHYDTYSMHVRVVLALMAEAKAAALASVKLLSPKLMEYNRESQYSGVKQQRVGAMTRTLWFPGPCWP